MSDKQEYVSSGGQIFCAFALAIVFGAALLFVYFNPKYIFAFPLVPIGCIIVGNCFCEDLWMKPSPPQYDPDFKPSQQYQDRLQANEILKFVISLIFGISLGMVVGLMITFPIMELGLILAIPKMIWKAIF